MLVSVVRLQDLLIIVASPTSFCNVFWALIMILDLLECSYLLQMIFHPCKLDSTFKFIPLFLYLLAFLSNFSLFDCIKIDKRFGFYTRDEGTLDSYFTGFHIWMLFSLLQFIDSHISCPPAELSEIDQYGSCL